MRNRKLTHFCVLLILLLANKPSVAQIEYQKRPVLAEFIQMIMSNHPTIDEGRARLKASQARAKGQSRPLYNPEMEVEYENAEVNTSTIGLSQTIDWSGKRNSRSQVADAEVKVMLATMEITQKTLLAEILKALSNYQISLKTNNLNANRVELSKRFLSIAKDRNSTGDLSPSELLTANLSLSEAKVNYGQSLIDLSNQHEKLVSLTGEEREIWPILLGVPFQDNLFLSNENIQTFPEVKLANAKTATYRNRVLQAQKERSPDPTLGVKYGEEGKSNLFGFRLSVPLPVRNSFRAEVDASRADYLATEKNAQVILRRINSRLNASKRKYQAAQEAWYQWDSEGANNLQKQKQLLQKLWENGEIGAVDYMVQFNQTFNSQEASIISNGQVWLTWIGFLEAANKLNEWMENIR